ncbi:MAG: hypothetical protein V3S18_06440 [Dehalococcoidia bacterium]
MPGREATEPPAALPTATTAPPTPVATLASPLLSQARTALEAELDRIGARAARQRGFKAAPDPDRAFIDSDELAGLLIEELSEPDVVVDIANEEALYKLLGLIGQDDDLPEHYFNLYSTGVIGLYDPDTGKLFVLSGVAEPGDLTDRDERVYVHEYIHFLQDGLFDLSAMEDAAAVNSDRTMAFLTLVEGDARYSESLYAEAPVGGPRPSAPLTEFRPPPSPAPPYVLRRALNFPYSTGRPFIAALSREGGLTRVNAAYSDPPTTTEQVLHPEKYLSGELGRDLTLPDAADVLGPGWEQQDRNTLGEFGIAVWLEALGGFRGPAARAAAGWDGDAHLLMAGPAGEHAVAGVLAWDTPADAEEFYLELSDVLDRSGAFVDLPCPDGPSGDCPRPAGGWAWDGPGGVLALTRSASGRLAAFAVAPDAGRAAALADQVMAAASAGYTSP